MTKANGLWDSFWAVHASQNALFHRFLWRVRFLFSTAYSRHIAQTTGPLHAPRLLEIGCGSARTLHYLDRAYPASQCYAVDLSPQAIRLVRSLSPHFRAALADAVCLPLAAGQIDVSFSIGLIEHFTREQAARIVAEKIRVTKTGGVVAVMVPWESSVYNAVVRKAAGQHWPFGAEHPFHRRELALFLQQLGLAKIQIHIVFGTTLLGIGRKL